MKMKSWWSLDATEGEAMKRLEFEPELRDRCKRHKGLSIGTLFKLLASILTQNGSWEQIFLNSFSFVAFPSCGFVDSFDANIESISIPSSRRSQMRRPSSQSQPVKSNIPFRLLFFSFIFINFPSFDEIPFRAIDFILIQVQRIDVSENMRSTAAMHLTICKPNI